MFKELIRTDMKLDKCQISNEDLVLIAHKLDDGEYLSMFIAMKELKEHILNETD